ncbi:unnamed protein product [Darwinula stevensoni]|uniref:Uncharacterized protein n=1 Tax=Darwinula stevensoni TaxID=69355 RepID=A0A7R9A8Q2_9CRUS|nr:unnamed protein product [Darwinula stevensoni]CAG0896498.1 unnamed protein product [Darwinula stevensoni]
MDSKLFLKSANTRHFRTQHAGSGVIHLYINSSYKEKCAKRNMASGDKPKPKIEGKYSPRELPMVPETKLEKGDHENRSSHNPSRNVAASSTPHRAREVSVLFAMDVSPSGTKVCRNLLLVLERLIFAWIPDKSHFLLLPLRKNSKASEIQESLDKICGCVVGEVCEDLPEVSIFVFKKCRSLRCFLVLSCISSPRATELHG